MVHLAENDTKYRTMYYLDTFDFNGMRKENYPDICTSVRKAKSLMSRMFA